MPAHHPAQSAYILARALRDATREDRAALLAPIPAQRDAGTLTREQHRAQVAQAEHDHPAIFRAAYEASALYLAARENLLTFARAAMHAAAERHPEALPEGPAPLDRLFDAAGIVGKTSDRLIDLALMLKA